VKLDNRTYLTRNDQKAQLADLTLCARVVVDIPEGSKDKVAHSVKIGAITNPVDKQAQRLPEVRSEICFGPGNGRGTQATR
jgi:hypothetical protein